MAIYDYSSGGFPASPATDDTLAMKGTTYKYNGSAWEVQTGGTTSYTYTATSGQTAFTGADTGSKTLAYTAASIHVFLNGVLLDAADYTATDGTTVTLGTGASTGDTLQVVAYGVLVSSGGGGGTWEVIQSQTVSSSVTSVVFNTGITGYTHYKLLFTCYYSGHTSATAIWVSSDGGSTYEGNSWKVAQTTVKSDGIAANNTGWASSGGKLGINRYNHQFATTQYLSAEVMFTGLTEGVWTHANSDCINYVSSTTASAASTFAIMPTTTAYNAIKISESNSTATIDSGTFTLYGIKNS